MSRLLPLHLVAFRVMYFYIFCYAVESSFQAYEVIKKLLINSPSNKKFLHRDIEEVK